MLGQQQTVQQPQQKTGLLSGITSFFQQNPELFGSLLGAVGEGLTGGDVSIGAQQGLIGASRVTQLRQQKEAIAMQQQQGLMEQILKQQEKAKEETLKQENVLRKEFDTQTKSFNQVMAANKKIEASLVKGTAAGDLAGIFAFMKVLDPGSTVREGEFANAQNSAGIPDQIKNLYNRAVEGKRLGEAQREDFLRTARGLFESERQVYDDIRGRFARQSERQGLDIKNVVGDISVEMTPIEQLIEKSKKNELNRPKKEKRPIFNFSTSRRKTVSVKELE